MSDKIEKSRAQRIPDALWESHRTTIHRLYVTENRPLTAPGGVVEIMARDHGFFARSVLHTSQNSDSRLYALTITVAKRSTRHDSRDGGFTNT
jgi:hypothetical protein